MHSPTLSSKISSCFPELQENDAKLIHKPFTVNVFELPENVQKELTNLVNGSMPWDAHGTLPLSKFSPESIHSYPQLVIMITTKLLPFLTIYHFNMDSLSCASSRTNYKLGFVWRMTLSWFCLKQPAKLKLWLSICKLIFLNEFSACNLWKLVYLEHP